MKGIYLTIVVVLSALYASAQLFTPGAGVTDIDGNNYPSVVLNNGQEWMAENLKTGTYSDGTTIPNVISDNQWATLQTGSWAFYNHDNLNEASYGKLYNWWAVSDARGLCPEGWHVPSDQEITSAIAMVDPNQDPNGSGIQSSFAARAFREMGFTHWVYHPANSSTNITGFSARPSGTRYVNGDFDLLGTAFCMWTSTPNGIDAGYMRSITNNSEILFRNSQEATNGCAIRCIKNETVTSVQSMYESNLKVSPNPSNGFYLLNQSGFVRVYDTMGKLAYKANIIAGEQIDITNEPTGIYFLQFEGKEGNATIKLVRE